MHLAYCLSLDVSFVIPVYNSERFLTNMEPVRMCGIMWIILKMISRFLVGNWHFIRTFLIPILFVGILYAAVNHFYVINCTSLLSLLVVCGGNCFFTFLICLFLLFAKDDRQKMYNMFFNKIRL